MPLAHALGVSALGQPMKGSLYLQRLNSEACLRLPGAIHARHGSAGLGRRDGEWRVTERGNRRCFTAHQATQHSRCEPILADTSPVPRVLEHLRLIDARVRSVANTVGFLEESRRGVLVVEPTGYANHRARREQQNTEGVSHRVSRPATCARVGPQRGVVCAAEHTCRRS